MKEHKESWKPEVDIQDTNVFYFKTDLTFMLRNPMVDRFP